MDLDEAGIEANWRPSAQEYAEEIGRDLTSDELCAFRWAYLSRCPSPEHDTEYLGGLTIHEWQAMAKEAERLLGEVIGIAQGRQIEINTLNGQLSSSERDTEKLAEALRELNRAWADYWQAAVSGSMSTPRLGQELHQTRERLLSEFTAPKADER